MNFLTILEAKRDGVELSETQIRGFVDSLVQGVLPEYQVAAFLMAIYFRGLSPSETRILTQAMRSSGEQLAFPDDPRPLVDKHSTGGVGDKVSLVLAPLLACLGLRIPMMAGRGLGITGGTLDKLESIPGFQTRLSREHIVAQVQEIGCCICGQTEQMVPADRILYALRDVTGTVPSIPLITASILSKKLSESLEALVLDVTCGRAAFMREPAAAKVLAHDMVRLAKECGVKTRALVTSMDRPLGRSAGNWLEILEVEECLKGGGPEDLRELVLEFGAEILWLTGLDRSRDSAMSCMRDLLRQGAAHQRWLRMLAAQGADVALHQSRVSRGTLANVVREYPAARDGVVMECDARVIGEVVRDLGGGRFSKTDQPRGEVGIDRLMQVGERVILNQPLARVHAADEESIDRIWPALGRAFHVGDGPAIVQPLILDRIE